jgi:hypothetical protein
MPAPSTTARSVAARHRKTSRRSWLVLLVLVAAWLLTFGHMQAVGDWFRQLGYTPSSTVSALATDDSFTPAAQHLYAINRPTILPKGQFSAKCANHQEQTIVLGCYHGYERGIYVLQIAADSRLKGVEQVTAAHEMLHAAYDRLSGAEQKWVDAMLLDYYEHDLTDMRIKQTIAAYKHSEPDAVVNEMYSVFGTEVANLPAPLEHYYKRYFADRQKVAAYAAGYQAEFISRQQQVVADDAKLASLKKTIVVNEATLKAQSVQLHSRAQQMNQLRSSGQTDAYNAEVTSFNTAVDAYNKLAATTKSQIAEYNQLVEQRNALALEQQQLANELSGNGVSTISNQ